MTVDVPTRPGTSPGTVRRGALALLCAVNFMVIMDAQIVILALPAIRTGLGFSETGVQWVLSSYLLCFGGLLLLGGRAGDLLGRRRMLQWGTALFGLSSLLCAVAGTPWLLIAARAAQGISAALMAPTALAILTTTWPDGQARTRALTRWGIVGGLGATAALLVGGGLSTLLSWHWIFWINVPVALVLLVLNRRLLTESTVERATRAFDPLGATTLTLGLGAAIYAVVGAPVAGWGSVQTIGLLIAAVALIAGFGYLERRVVAPILELSLLRLRSLLYGNAAVFTTGLSAWGLGIVTSSYAQGVLAFTPLSFGIGTLALTLGAVAGGQAAQHLLPRLGNRTTVLAALSQLAGCLYLTQLSAGGNYWSDLFPGLLLFGLGLGSATVLGSVAAMADVPERLSGIASGINTAAFQLGGAFGSALVTTVVVTRAGARAGTAPLNDGMFACVCFAAVLLVIAVLSTRRAAR